MRELQELITPNQASTLSTMRFLCFKGH